MSYRMTRLMYNNLLKAISTKERKAQEKDIIAYVNREFKLRYHVSSLSLA